MPRGDVSVDHLREQPCSGGGGGGGGALVVGMSARMAEHNLAAQRRAQRLQRITINPAASPPPAASAAADDDWAAAAAASAVGGGGGGAQPAAAAGGLFSGEPLASSWVGEALTASEAPALDAGSELLGRVGQAAALNLMLVWLFGIGFRCQCLESCRALDWDLRAGSF